MSSSPRQEQERQPRSRFWLAEDSGPRRRVSQRNLPRDRRFLAPTQHVDCAQRIEIRLQHALTGHPVHSFPTIRDIRRRRAREESAEALRHRAAEALVGDDSRARLHHEELHDHGEDIVGEQVWRDHNRFVDARQEAGNVLIEGIKEIEAVESSPIERHRVGVNELGAGEASSSRRRACHLDEARPLLDTDESRAGRGCADQTELAGTKSDVEDLRLLADREQLGCPCADIDGGPVIL